MEARLLMPLVFRLPTLGKAALVGAFLLVIAMICAAIFFLSPRQGSDRQKTANAATEEAASKNETATHATKPSPAVPLREQRLPSSPNSSTRSAQPMAWPADGMQVTAHHKGHSGCQGMLILKASGLQFTCPSNDAKSFSVALTDIRGTDDDGIVTTSGAKYHFDKVPGGDKEYVERLFQDWLSRSRLVQNRIQ
jgi:hypothetical protein